MESDDESTTTRCMEPGDFLFIEPGTVKKLLQLPTTLGNTGFVSLKVFSVSKAGFHPDSKYTVRNCITSVF